MNIVGGGIVILDLYRLSSHHAQNVRMILASTLVEHDRSARHIERAIAQPVFYVHEHVCKIAVGHNYVFGLVGSLAARVLAHVDLRSLGSHALERYLAAERSYGRGIDWSDRGSRLSWLLGCVRGLFSITLAACRQEDQYRQGHGAGHRSYHSCFLIHIHNVALS